MDGDSNEENDNFECHPDVHDDQWTCVSHECKSQFDITNQHIRTCGSIYSNPYLTN